MSRTSEYGNLINKLAPWVFGGEYGQISNMLNNREQEYEATRAAQAQNDIRELELEKQQRQADFEEELRRRDIFGGNDGTPATLRDMYGRVRDVAMEQGNVDYAMRLEEKLQQIQDQQEKEARQKILQDRDDEKWNWEKERRGRTGTGGGSDEVKGSKILIGPDGSPELVRKSEYNDKIRTGYVDPDLMDEQEQARMMREEAASKSKKSEPGAVGSFLDGIFGGDKPGDAPAQAQKDIVDQIKQSAPPRPPRQGMKWQRNKKTGELREVPA